MFSSFCGTHLVPGLAPPPPPLPSAVAQRSVTSTSSSESEPSQLLPELASTSTALMSILDIGVDRVPHGSGSVARRLVER